MDFTIRTVREEDAESIVQLLNPIIRAGEYTVIAEPLSVEDQLDFIRGFPKGGVFHVAVCNESHEVFGLQDVLPKPGGSEACKHVGEISTFVSLGLRGRGIGRRLSHATFREAREQGFLKLSATVRADNPQALEFYLSQGFRIVGTRQRHAQVKGKHIDGILMEKSLDR